MVKSNELSTKIGSLKTFVLLTHLHLDLISTVHPKMIQHWFTDGGAGVAGNEHMVKITELIFSICFGVLVFERYHNAGMFIFIYRHNLQLGALFNVATGGHSRVQASEQTVAALKQHTQFNIPVDGTEANHFYDISGSDISKINWDEHKGNEEYLIDCENRAYEFATIFQKAVNGKSSLGGYVKCEIYPLREQSMYNEPKYLTPFIPRYFYNAYIAAKNASQTNPTVLFDMYNYWQSILGHHYFNYHKLRYCLDMNPSHYINNKLQKKCPYEHDNGLDYSNHLQFNLGVPECLTRGHWDKNDKGEPWFIYNDINERPAVSAYIAKLSKDVSMPTVAFDNWFEKKQRSNIY